MQIEITKQSEKDFRFLLSRLSHEIRNPVTLINSELQLMALKSRIPVVMILIKSAPPCFASRTRL